MFAILFLTARSSFHCFTVLGFQYLAVVLKGHDRDPTQVLKGIRLFIRPNRRSLCNVYNLSMREISERCMRMYTENNENYPISIYFPCF